MHKIYKEQELMLEDSPELYFNRDVNWQDFNSKVLDQALNKDLALLDRLKFLAIFYNNLDEYFMVRVANIYRQYKSGVASKAPDGITPTKQLAIIRKKTMQLLNKAQTFYRKELHPALFDKMVRIVSYSDLTVKQQIFLDGYFKKEVYPILTPQAIDPGHPLPTISNLCLNLIVQLKCKDGNIRFARVKCPNNLSRFVFIPRNKEAKNYASLGFSCHGRDEDILLLEDLIMEYLPALFPGNTVLNASVFRISRNTDVEIEEDEADDLLEAIQDLVEQRRFGDIVRLEIAHGANVEISKFLINRLAVQPFQVYKVRGPLAFSELLGLYDINRPGLKEASIKSRNSTLFDHSYMYGQIKNDDVILFHPYDSFTPVLDFIRRASEDPNVVAIKQTLYRVGSNSPIVSSLIEARKRGKQVTVVVELKARFDEERNITWAKELEKYGVHVVYGIVGMKIHAKLCLVVRKEHGAVVRYAHIGTGNYNAGTAKIYSDMSLFTANNEICSDITDLFNVMTGYANQDNYRRLLVSPLNVRSSLLQMIENEIQNQQKFGNGHIVFKCNQLTDPKVIFALYQASNAGVKIDLQIRGVCCLRPNLSHASENITVTSIVGKFLEHSRVYYFYNNAEEKIYFGSADLMQRNLDRRIEVLCPILDKRMQDFLIEKVLAIHLQDNVNSYKLCADGQYEKIKRAHADPIDAHALMSEIEYNIR